MTKLSTLLLILFGRLVLPVAADGAPRPQSATPPSGSNRQLLTLSGKVTMIGAQLLSSADQKLCQILNFETLRHLEGEYVTRKARLLPETGRLYLAAVRASASPEDSVKHEDGAFPRSVNPLPTSAVRVMRPTKGSRVSACSGCCASKQRGTLCLPRFRLRRIHSCPHLLVLISSISIPS